MGLGRLRCSGAAWIGGERRHYQMNEQPCKQGISRLCPLRRPLGCLGRPGLAILFGCCFFHLSLRVLARWFLHVGFQVIFSNSCDFRIECERFCTQNLFLACLVYPFWHHLGRPWEQQDGHVGVRNPICSNLVTSFFGTEGKNYSFFSNVFPGHTVYRFLGRSPGG